MGGMLGLSRALFSAVLQALNYRPGASSHHAGPEGDSDTDRQADGDHGCGRINPGVGEVAPQPPGSCTEALTPRTSDFDLIWKESCCRGDSAQLPSRVQLLQSHGVQLAQLPCPWNFLGKTTGMSCHALLQGIYLTQG